MMFIEKWQTLIGSALGPFLAIIFSVFGFYVKGKYQKRCERKEAARQAEISFSITINQIYATIGRLNDFVSRVKSIISEVENITDPIQYSLHETNFPPTINIYFNDKLLNMGFRSYYIHNKILMIDSGVKWTNGTIQAIKLDFEKLLNKNVMMTERTNPLAQRSAYIENLKGFIEMVQVILNSLKNDNVKSIAQAKVYNHKLMKKHFLTLWKYERTTLKYFKNNKEKEEYKNNLSVIDRIDSLLENEANKLLEKAQKRAAELGIFSI